MHTEPTRESVRPGLLAGIVAICLLLGGQSGCTSALTTASLTNGLWQGAEHAAEAGSPAEAETPADLEAEATDVATEAMPHATTDRARREAALEEAMSRLARLGPIDPAVEAALVATLQRTQPEDWPIVVDEFAASLPATAAASTPPTAVAAEPPAAEPAAAAEQAAVTDEPPVAVDERAPEGPPTTSRDEPADASGVAVDQPPLPAGSGAPTVAVRSACFASAVRAWGDVDRFPADRFKPGQEVIVYVELDHLAVGTSPSGHTTCVDGVLRLMDDADHTLHTWTFDPIAETCTGRRRDYFARYVVRIPDTTPPGGCRVELSITDTIAGTTAGTSLPLEVAALD